MTKYRLMIALIFLALVLLLSSPGAVHFLQWDSTSQTLNQVSVEVFGGETSLIPVTSPMIKTGDCVEYSSHHLILHRCDNNDNSTAWESPGNWSVTEVIQADLNKDGNEEFALVVWRPFAPWPIDKFLPYGGRITEFHNKAGMSAHLILVGWDGDEYRELWAGSALANPISTIRTVDIDRDGYKELIAIEGDYDSAVEAGNITIWQWQGFGFTLLNRLEGNYSGYEVYRNDQQTSILTY